MWVFILSIIIVIFIVCVSNHNNKKEQEARERRERQRRGTVYPQQNNTVPSQFNRAQTLSTQQKKKYNIPPAE